MAIPLEEVERQALRELLPIEGVVGISRAIDRLIVYVETQADKAKVPRMYKGWPVEVRVVGRVRPL